MVRELELCETREIGRMCEVGGDCEDAGTGGMGALGGFDQHGGVGQPEEVMERRDPRQLAGFQVLQELVHFIDAGDFDVEAGGVIEGGAEQAHPGCGVERAATALVFSPGGEKQRDAVQMVPWGRGLSGGWVYEQVEPDFREVAGEPDFGWVGIPQILQAADTADDPWKSVFE